MGGPQASQTVVFSPNAFLPVAQLRWSSLREFTMAAAFVNPKAHWDHQISRSLHKHALTSSLGTSLAPLCSLPPGMDCHALKWCQGSAEIRGHATNYYASKMLAILKCSWSRKLLASRSASSEGLIGKAGQRASLNLPNSASCICGADQSTWTPICKLTPVWSWKRSPFSCSFLYLRNKTHTQQSTTYYSTFKMNSNSVVTRKTEK